MTTLDAALCLSDTGPPTSKTVDAIASDSANIEGEVDFASRENEGDVDYASDDDEMLPLVPAEDLEAELGEYYLIFI
jgi:hypothetical protein